MVMMISVIILLAFGLRAWGIGFGLPYEFHVDEDQYVRQAATMGESGLHPADWFNPPFFKYLLLVEYGGLYVIGRLFGIFASTSDFGAQMSLDPSWLYLLGRLTSVFVGAATVGVVCWIGSKGYIRRVGIIAALLVAVAFLPVRESHFAVNDAAATLWMTLALLGAIGIWKSRRFVWVVISGVAIGLGFATKYTTLAAILPILTSLLLIWKNEKLSQNIINLSSFAGISLISAMIVSPFFILEPARVWNAISRLSFSGQFGYYGWLIDPAGAALYYLKTASWGLGIPLLFFSLMAVLYAVWKHRGPDLILLAFILPVFVYLSLQQTYFGRFLLPIIPPLMVLAASALTDLWVGLKLPTAAKTLVTAGLLVLIALPTLSASLRFDYLLTRKDTRTLAKEWIETNLPAGSAIAEDWIFHCPPLSTVDKTTANSLTTFNVWVSAFPDGQGITDNTLQWYRAQNFDYLIACSNIYLLQRVDAGENFERQTFYQNLDQQLTLVKSFGPTKNGTEPAFIFDELYAPAIQLWDRVRPGPEIKIYQIK